jgi:hypothetical protein
MSNRDGCPNQDCNWTMVATPGTNESSTEPRCICGRTMQKGDAVPAFHYLDFLRDDTAEGREAGAEEE